MWAELSTQYAGTCRYDYVKLSFVDSGPEYTNFIRDEVQNAWNNIQAANKVYTLVKPAYTHLNPTSSRPLGRLIVELFGLAAMAVYDLPASWMQFLTYAHVKAYGEYPNVEQLVGLQVKLLTSRGPRNIALNIQGNRSRTGKGMLMPSIRLGSRKSDWHGIIYCRVGENMGVEGRFTDERLAQHTLRVFDTREAHDMPDTAMWSLLLRQLGRESAQLWSEELQERGIDLAKYVGSFDGYNRNRLQFDDESSMLDEKSIELPSPADGEGGSTFPTR